MMLKLILETFIRISGIAAASGLVYHGEELHIVSDNSNYLYHYHLGEQRLYKTVLLEASPMENVPKASKMDLESIAFDGKSYYLYGSGSTGRRNDRFIWDGKQLVHEDYSRVYTLLMKKFRISEEDFNIEGVLHIDDRILFFNRGNGPNGINGILEYYPASENRSRYIPMALPTLNGVATGFSDATLVGNDIYFIATAEDAKSTYDDGEIAGSMLGKLSADLRSAPEVWPIPENHKFEGITLKEAHEDGLVFLLCADSDSEDEQLIVYSLKVTN
ncbi:DUF6929 family protein [Sphingobacterium thalpophilum]|uniref:Phytase-like domain-containing protein n=1 Tax=Sphingobacterium thalpophilum TaxID=259 RepID=A0A4U9UPJ8_9SPHI|nr:hypothetical protein [Sphingobacterium thalpophilum]VTR35650.1 Uncharacterised protein [Sphingobacterium thalpophilum]